MSYIIHYTKDDAEKTVRELYEIAAEIRNVGDEFKVEPTKVDRNTGRDFMDGRVEYIVTITKESNGWAATRPMTMKDTFTWFKAEMIKLGKWAA